MCKVQVSNLMFLLNELANQIFLGYGKGDFNVGSYSDLFFFFAMYVCKA